MAGQLPTLELYVTLKREQAEKDSFIIEKTAEGFPMAAAVFFRCASTHAHSSCNACLHSAACSTYLLTESGSVLS